MLAKRQVYIISLLFISITKRHFVMNCRIYIYMHYNSIETEIVGYESEVKPITLALFLTNYKALTGFSLMRVKHISHSLDSSVLAVATFDIEVSPCRSVNT